MIKNLPKNRTVFIVTLAVFTMIFSFGCDKFKKKPSATVNQQPKPASQPKQAAKPVQNQVSSLKVTPAAGNQYDFSTKKDPFKPFAVIKVDQPAPGSRQLSKSGLPIHSFDLSQFRLVGIVADPKGNKAMVMDPTGKAYVLNIGMSIGKAEGKVSKISTAGVEVVEEFRDENGKSRKETIKIPMLRKP